MQYLKLKRRKNADATQKKRADEAYFVTATGKRDLYRTETYISKRHNYLLLGDADSGKTRILKRLSAHGYYDRPVLYLSAIDPIASWLGEGEGTQAQRLDALLTRIERDKVVVMIDDAHRLSGRKTQVAKQILAASSRYWLSSTSLSRIPPSIRRYADSAGVRTLELDSKVAFDATTGLVVVMIILGLAAGHPEFAMLAGAGGLLASGRLASRKD